MWYPRKIVDSIAYRYKKKENDGFESLVTRAIE